MPADLVSSLTLSAPELMLAVGAMVLLMIGAYSGERANTLVSGLAVAILLLAGAWLVLFRPMAAPSSPIPSRFS
jgi:NADH-quinone oxidoreductase subunit N